MSSSFETVFEEKFDTEYLITTLRELAKIPTHVVLGYETFIDPDDPKLVYYVQEVMKPKIKTLGYTSIKDVALNNLVLELGSDKSNKSLIIQNYTPTQHFNLMENPFSGDLEDGAQYGIEGKVVLGQGVSQNKSHQAVMLTLLKLFKEANITLSGKLYWTINNEGNSSHMCTNAILDSIQYKPDFGILQINSGLSMWLGNRGRVDINVHVQGKATHSSSPEMGLSSIEGVNEVLNLLKTVKWEDTHPLLGSRHLVPYKIRYEPIAPHTLPSDGYIAIDRRLLPGDNIDEAITEVRDLLSEIDDYQITVTEGYSMVPALVDADNINVKSLREIHQKVTGQDVTVVYGGGAFDAGGLCDRGIPTVMYGCAGGDGLLGTDYVSINDVVTEAKVLFLMICEMLEASFSHED